MPGTEKKIEKGKRKRKGIEEKNRMHIESSTSVKVQEVHMNVARNMKMHLRIYMRLAIY